MKSIYVTYIENGKTKKGKLSEDKFLQLHSSGRVTELVTYLNERLMEQSFGQMLCSDGKCDNRDILRD